MIQLKQSYTPADDNTAGFANDVNTTSGLPFALTATTVADDMAHLVIITPSVSVTGNYTLTGTDADGAAQTETLATSTTNPVTSAKYYNTLTSVLAPSGIGAATVDIGWTDDVVSPTVPVKWHQHPFQVGIAADVAGTISYTVQHAYDALATAQDLWFPKSDMTAKTVDADASYATPVTGVRLLLNSLTAGATIVFYVLQGK